MSAPILSAFGAIPPELRARHPELEGIPDNRLVTGRVRRSGPEIELKQGETFDPNVRSARAQGNAQPSSRAQQLEQLRGAPQWAQPGRQMSSVEAPSQEDMLYYIMNNTPRNTSKFVNAFGKNAFGKAMAEQQTGFEGMPTGAVFADDALDSFANVQVPDPELDPLVGMIMQQQANAAESPAPKKTDDGYMNMLRNWFGSTRDFVTERMNPQ